MDAENVRDALSAANGRDEGDARWLREGCECERRGVPEAGECVYESPCPDEQGQARLRAASPTHPGLETETQYLLMIDYFPAMSGIYGSESRHLPHGTTEADAIEQARAALKKARRVEVWTREVPIDWMKAEEFNRA